MYELPNDLLEEYKICQEKAEHLERNVYTSATIFGGGSAAAIVVLLNLLGKDASWILTLPQPVLLISIFIIAAVAIATWLTWLRLTHRWLSIVNVMFIRMEHIERQSDLRANLYVRYLNHYWGRDKELREVAKMTFTKKKEEANLSKPFLDEYMQKNLKELTTKFYERRSQVSMLTFLAIINISAWLFIFLLQLFRFFLEEIPPNVYFNMGLFVTVIILCFSYIFYLRSSWIKE